MATYIILKDPFNEFALCVMCMITLIIEKTRVSYTTFYTGSLKKKGTTLSTGSSIIHYDVKQ